MTASELPPAISQFIDATNAGDSASFLDAFSSDANLNDWGREFHGRDEIADWNRTDNIGVRSHFDLVESAETSPGVHRVVLTVTGDGYNGTGPMEFSLRDGKIASVRIG
jgi:hypothetical protein